MTDATDDVGATDEPQLQQSDQRSPATPTDESQETPPATAGDSADAELLVEVRDLRLQVERVSSWMDGSMSMLRLMSIGIAILAAFGVFQLVNSAINSSVRNRVAEEVSSQVGDLTARLDAIESALAKANESAAIAENAANRAELAAQSAGARPNTAYYFPSTNFAGALEFVTGDGNWVIVVASDDAFESARARTEEDSIAPYEPTIIFVGDEFLSTIGPYESYLEAADALLPIRLDVNPLAYILDLRGYCIEPSLVEEGYLECRANWPTP